MGFITDHGIKTINEILLEDGFIACPTDLIESYPYVYHFAKSIGWSDELINKTLRSIKNLNGFQGDKAGVYLKWILFILSDNNQSLSEMLRDSCISYREVDPRTHTLTQILKVFADKNVKSIDIGFMFGGVCSYYFIDLLYAYKMGNLKNE